MKRLNAVILIIFLILNLFFLSSCSKNKLIGTWIPVTRPASYNYPEEGFQLNEDGTGMVEGSIEITWWIENRMLFMSDNGRNYSYNVSFEGDLLYLDEYAYYRYSDGIENDIDYNDMIELVDQPDRPVSDYFNLVYKLTAVSESTSGTSYSNGSVNIFDEYNLGFATYISITGKCEYKLMGVYVGMNKKDVSQAINDFSYDAGWNTTIEPDVKYSGNYVKSISVTIHRDVYY